MKAYLLVFTLLLLAKSNAQTWQQRADYNINVQLNDTLHTLDGTVELRYHNNSPDTLRELWIHLWPNAYKNDLTAYASQTLLGKDTKFYFSKENERGYINRLNFTVNGTTAKLTDHPDYIDAARIELPFPLAPGDQLVAASPFHVQLPYLFSRGGHIDQFYSATQWFPKVAVYDSAGWHVMPYLYTGEYYSNFGNYSVSITLPDNYVVAATGTLLSDKALNNPQVVVNAEPVKKAPKQLFPPATKTVSKSKTLPSSSQLKTLRYAADNVIDFAWFADKAFIVKEDEVVVDGNKVRLYNYMHESDTANWKNSMMFTKRAISFYSENVGAYPYPQASVVSHPGNWAEGMEYPMITLLNMKPHNEMMLDLVIAHELGHNWFQAILATNERDHAWMDEGINTFLEKEYERKYWNKGSSKAMSYSDFVKLQLLKLKANHEDAPVETPSEQMKPDTYGGVVYEKASQFLQSLKKEIGEAAMASLIKTYYATYKFRHPNPASFRQLAEQVSGKSLSNVFAQLETRGPAFSAQKRTTQFTFLPEFKRLDSVQYLSVFPSVGYNVHDGMQVGVMLHNYNAIPSRFEFGVTPMFATKSKQLTGYAHAALHLPAKKFQSVTASVGAAHFAQNSFAAADGSALAASFTKIAPAVTFDFKKKNLLSTTHRELRAKLFYISEQQVKLDSPEPPGDTVFYAVKDGSNNVAIPQLTYTVSNKRVLYPWQAQFEASMVKQLVRLSFNGNYSLNYRKDSKAATIRLFAGKIFYTADATSSLRNSLSRYHFTMYAPNGEQDFTYSSPFMDRNQNTGLAGRQVHMRDGGFKYRSDYSSVIPGLRSNALDYFDNWMITLNSYIDIPKRFNPLSFLPVELPLQLFADAGTSSSAWKAGNRDSRFLYSVGLHLPLFKFLHVYYPVVHSKAFNEPNSVNDPFKAGGPSWWQRRLTFSIDANALKNRLRALPFDE